MPKAVAAEEGRFEYSVAENFENDGKIPLSAATPILQKQLSVKFLPFHEVQIQSSNRGINVSGTSLISQQVIVIPADKYSSSIQHDDYGDARKKEADIAGELLLDAVELGVLDGNAVDNLLGGSGKKTLSIAPKKGGVGDGGDDWKAGDYVVLMSGGREFDRITEGQPASAWHKNLLMLLGDSISASQVISGPIATALGIAKEVSPKVFSLGSVEADCIPELEKSVSNFIGCLGKPDNVVNLASFIGLDGKNIGKGTSDVMGALLNFTGEAMKEVKNALEEVGGAVGEILDVPSKFISVNRLFYLGSYLERDNVKGPYVSKFRVVDVTIPGEFTIDCERPNKFRDLELSCSAGFLGFAVYGKNISSDWYEVTRIYKGEETITLIAPGAEAKLDFDAPKGALDRAAERMNQQQRDLILGAEGRKTQQNEPLTTRVDKLSSKVRKFIGSPSRQVSLSCDGSPTEIWDVEFTPKCNSEGIFVEIRSTVEIPLKLDYGNQQFLAIQPQFGGGHSHLTSPNRTTNFVLSVAQ